MQSLPPNMCDHQHVIHNLILRPLNFLANETKLAVRKSIDSAKVVKP